MGVVVVVVGAEVAGWLSRELVGSVFFHVDDLTPASSLALASSKRAFSTSVLNHRQTPLYPVDDCEKAGSPRRSAGRG